MVFSTKEQLKKRTGKHGTGRFEYLQQLVTEYKTTKSRESKKQVLANLANFAYDPVNYEYLWRLKILDLFFSVLEEKNNQLISYALSGICNICLDPLSKKYILRTGGIKFISSLLNNSEEAIVLSSITTLIYLNTPESKQDIATAENVQLMLQYSKGTNRRIKNLASVFLEDVCGIKVYQEAVKRKIPEPSTSAAEDSIAAIPIQSSGNSNKQSVYTDTDSIHQPFIARVNRNAPKRIIKVKVKLPK